MRGYVVMMALAAIPVSVRADDDRLDFFEKKVRPIFAQHCYACHSADTKPAGGLRVDDRNGLLTGGNTGKAIVPGKPEASLLLKRVAATAKRRMPLEGEHLSDVQIADLTRWVKDGAAWPALRPPASLGKVKPAYEKLKKEHWAFQPSANPKPPAVHDAAWPKDDIDRFILAKLEANDMKPAGAADKVALIRRVTFDLTGLPPTPAEVEDFVKDASTAAFEKVVDRLLASPRFGEHWGRHWLDVARYAESTGPSRNIPYPHAWKYRDYVIDSFNADVPFDRFVTEQIAGDLLPAADDAEKNRLLTATGFLALGVKDVNQRFKVRFIMDNVDEQVDAVSRSLLALTVSCARCHDHKFDPVPTTDYYALAGIFTSTENCAGLRNRMGGAGLAYYDPALLVRLNSDLPAPPAEQVAKLEAAVEEARKEWDAIRGTPEGLKIAANGFPTQRPFRLKFQRLQAELLALSDPAARGYAVHGARDAAVPGDTEVRIRGEAEKLGPPAPRGFLTAFAVPDAPKVNPNQSGRLELARWLASPQNPLTARVIANRVWQNLFGQGIVKTVDNFGVNGDVPSHPELLDHLANRLVRDGWSIKKLVRAVTLTRAYQLSSLVPENEFKARQSVDPANRLLWRHTPRRLSAEEIRDAILAAAGTLDCKRPSGSPTRELQMIEMRDNGPEASKIRASADESVSRSVYLPWLRGLIPQSLEAFDPADSTLVSGSRDATTVPAQALFLLNSAFVRKQALALANRTSGDKNATDEARIQNAYRLVLCRKATGEEIERASAFVSAYVSAYRAQLVAPAEKAIKPKTPVERKKSTEPPFDPDQVDQTGEPVVETTVQAKDARTAAWLALAQALYGSAEFRYLK